MGQMGNLEYLGFLYVIMSFIIYSEDRERGYGFRHSPRCAALAAAVTDESDDSYKELCDANDDCNICHMVTSACI